MRRSVFFLALVLSGSFAVDGGAAGARKAAAGHGARAGSTKPAPGAATKGGDTEKPGSDNPYGGPAASAAAPAEPSPPPSATGSEDTKLDEAPPPRSNAQSGPGPSPLNPEPKEMPNAAAPAGPSTFDKLMSDIAALRARVAALTTSLFSSKLQIAVRSDGDDAKITGFVVTLDGGVVFRAEQDFVADEERVLYEHAVAPGSHVIGVEVERQDRRGAAYRTWQSSRFSVDVPEKKQLRANLLVEDDSDMASDFPDDQDGTYELAIRLRAKVVP